MGSGLVDNFSPNLKIDAVRIVSCDVDQYNKFDFLVCIGIPPMGILAELAQTFRTPNLKNEGGILVGGRIDTGVVRTECPIWLLARYNSRGSFRALAGKISVFQVQAHRI